MKNKVDPIPSRGRIPLPLITFFLSFVFFGLVMWCAPYSSDDLEFASLPYTAFSEYLTYALEYGNGRLLGNLCAIWLTHSRVLCILVKAFVLATAVVLIPAVLELNTAADYLLSFLLLAAIDPEIFGEVYAWTSGFSNYMPPVWMTLVILWLLKQYPRTTRAAKAAICLCVAVLGVASQLFIEHSSGVNLLLALTFVLTGLMRRDKGSLLPGVIWLTAAAVGLILMLAIPVVFHIEDNHTDTYRSMNLGGISAIVMSCAKNVIQLSNHHFGACTVPMCFGAFATVHMTRSRRSEKANRLLFGANAVAAIYLVLSLMLGQADYLGKSALIQHAISGVFAFVPYVVWAAAAFSLENAIFRRKLLAILIFALISLVPLLVVTPIPARVVFQAHVFVILGALLCFGELRKHLPAGWIAPITRCAMAVALTLVVLLGSVFVSIRFMSQIREDHIRRELDAGATEIVIFRLPYDYTSWDHLWAQKYYNDTDRDVSFSSISFALWMNDLYS